MRVLILMAAGALLFSSTNAAESFLELRGDGSKIIFGAHDKHVAHLHATCPHAETTATYTWINPSSAFNGGAVNVGLGNVAPTCGHVADLSEPCAGGSGTVPPAFWCRWVSTTGASDHVVGPIHATRAFDEVGGVKLSMQVSAACPTPNVEGVFNLTMHHFASPGSAGSTELPYRGLPGANVVTVVLSPAMPPAVPPVPLLPPSAPPPYTGTDCHAIKQAYPDAGSDQYDITPSSDVGTIPVWCDMDADPDVNGKGYGYTVVMRVGYGGHGGTNCNSITCSVDHTGYFTAGAMGTQYTHNGASRASTVIDTTMTNHEFIGAMPSPPGHVQKLTDTVIDAIVDLRRGNAPNGHRFKWYTRGDTSNDVGADTGPHGYVYWHIGASQTFQFTSAMTQQCSRHPDNADDWSPYYTPNQDPTHFDQGLTTRSHGDSATNDIRCTVYSDDCGQAQGFDCSDNSDWAGAKYSTSYYDFCGRGESCDENRNVVLLLG